MNFDFIVIIEIWLYNNIDDNEFFFNFYNIYCKDCESRGGGVFLVVKFNIFCFRCCDLEESDCELLWGEIFFKDLSLYFVGFFYCFFLSDLIYLEGLVKLLDKVLFILEYVNIFFLGDFNFLDIDWNLISLL